MKLTLSKKIALFVGILIIAISIALTIVAYNLSSSTLLQQQQEQMLTYGEESANYLSAALSKNLAVLNEVAMRARTVTMDFAIQQESLRVDIERLGYQSMAVVLPSGWARDTKSTEGRRRSFRRAY